MTAKQVWASETAGCTASRATCCCNRCGASAWRTARGSGSALSSTPTGRSWRLIKSVNRRIEIAPGQWRTAQFVEDTRRLERITRAYRNDVLASFGFTPRQIKANNVAIDAGAADIGAGHFKGTVEPTVDATHHVDDGCRATSADGSRWECYLGEAAVRQRIIGQAFLGQHPSAPGVG